MDRRPDLPGSDLYDEAGAEKMRFGFSLDLLPLIGWLFRKKKRPEAENEKKPSA